MQGNPFARANAMMAAIAAAMSLAGSAQREAMSGIGPYRSRGKGSGKTSPSRHKVAMDRRGVHKVHGPKQSRSKYTPHFGLKERERAKRCYMSSHFHPSTEHERVSPTLCQIGVQSVDLLAEEYESVF